MCFLGWSVKQDGHPGIWIAETFSTRLHIVLSCTICGPLGLLLVMVVTRRTFCLLTIFVVSVTVVCAEPPDVPLSSIVVYGLETGDNATYTCDTGYAIDGQIVNVASATCQSDGSWTGVPSCVGNLFLILKRYVQEVLTSFYNKSKTSIIKSCHVVIYTSAIFVILHLFLCTHYCGWLSCMMSLVCVSPSCEQRETREKSNRKIYASAGNRTSDPSLSSGRL